MKDLLRHTRVNPLSIQFSRLAESHLTMQTATRANISPWIAVYDALPNPDPVLRKTSSRIEILDEIKREPHVSACKKIRKAGVIRRLWTIDKGNATPAATELIKKIFQNLNLETITREMLDGWGYGYKPLEIVWERSGDFYIPSKIVGLPQNWFCFGSENELRLKRKNDINSDPVEENKFLLTTYEASFDNPYGEAQYSLAFWPTTFKRGGIKHWAVMLDSYSMPHAIGKLPRGNSKGDIENLLNVLNGLVRDAAAVIPDDASVELLEANGSTGSSDGVFERHARYHDGEISKCILGHAAAVDSVPGKLGGNDPAKKISSDIIDDDCRMVMTAYNHLIKYIFTINPGLGEYRPSFRLYDEKKINTARVDRDCKLMSGGSVHLSKDYFIKHYGFYENEIEVI